MAYTTINKPSATAFNTKLYTGNGSTQTISGVGFQPDMSWTKVRSETGSHRLVDAVRGNTKYIYPNGTDAEQTKTNNVTSFDSDGYTLGNGSINENSRTYVAWNWKANGTGSANTAGDLNSTVSVNTTAGFSIVTYSGTGNFGESVGHGLGVAPSMIIARRLNGVEDWGVYHKALGASKYIILNTTGAEQSSTSRWGGVAPTNSVFTVGNHASVNVGSGTHVAYCFAEKQGYSKFGSYTGNGNADGTFVYTGFKPAFVLVKASSAGGTYNHWGIMDNKRANSFNVIDAQLCANISSAENDPSNIGNQKIDFLSNGFKPRVNGSSHNSSGVTYIYMAFAEAPLVGTNNVPCTAR